MIGEYAALVRCEMRALVTGGSGFIGSHVVRQLLDRGWHVRVLQLPGEKLLNLAGLDVERVAGDVTDRGSVERAIAGCDHVYHLAALFALWLPRRQRMWEVNVDGTRNVLRACLDSGTQRVVHTSSIAVFGGQGLDRDATEDSAFALRATGDFYSLTKWESHRVAKEFAERGLPVTIVAPCGPIGPGDVGPTPTGRLLLAAVQSPVAVAVHTISNLIDVRDCATGHLLAAERGSIGDTYLLGTANVSASELMGTARSLIYGSERACVVPAAVAEIAAHAALAYARTRRKAPLITPEAVRIGRLGLRADCRRAVKELGLPQRHIEDSVRDGLEWFAQHGYIRSRRVRRRLLASLSRDARNRTATTNEPGHAEARA